MPVLIHFYDKPALYRYSSILHRYVYTHIYTYLCTYIYFPEGMFMYFSPLLANRWAHSALSVLSRCSMTWIRLDSGKLLRSFSALCQYLSRMSSGTITYSALLADKLSGFAGGVKVFSIPAMLKAMFLFTCKPQILCNLAAFRWVMPLSHQILDLWNLIHFQTVLGKGSG